MTVDRILRQPPVHIDEKGLRAYRSLEQMAAKVSKEPTLINAAIPTNGGFSVAAYVDSIDLRQRISQRYRRWFPAAEHASGMKREYGKEELLSAETVTAPATVSGE